MMNVAISGTRPRGISLPRLQSVVEEVFCQTRRASRGDIAIHFVSEAEIAKLNASYRGKRRPTDVLSFASSASLGRSVGGTEKEYGDIIIAPAYAKREAERRGISLKEEVLRLVIHGTLHLLGYDHATPTDELRMFALQERILERMMY